MEISQEKIRIVGLSGSLRPNSYTKMAVEVALRGAQTFGVETRSLDLRDFDLVLCDGRDAAYPAGVKALRAEVKAAHGVIIGTPEYHGSYSGVIKNALDLMSFQELEGKMIGLVGVSGGSMGALQALNNLRTVGRALHAWVVPEQVGIPQAWQVFDKTGQVKDELLEKRLLEVGRQVARFAYLHTSKQMLEFLRLWEIAPTNPGGN